MLVGTRFEFKTIWEENESERVAPKKTTRVCCAVCARSQSVKTHPWLVLLAIPNQKVVSFLVRAVRAPLISFYASITFKKFVFRIRVLSLLLPRVRSSQSYTYSRVSLTIDSSELFSRVYHAAHRSFLASVSGQRTSIGEYT